MKSDAGSSTRPESSESMMGGQRGTRGPTGILSAQHHPRRYATVIPSESFEFPFEPGEVLAGKFRVLELLGVGGVGFVVAALHLHLDNRVALKFLKPEFVANPEALRSFTLEARASFKINSEHVARVYDVGALPNGMPFMVMELLNGRDMRWILQHQHVLPIECAVDFALQSCEALGAAHAMQIVHRDVKPENLFVISSGDAGHVKVLDFGIARVTAATNAHSGVTASMLAVGTPPYMSPEQIRGSRSLDARADQWSLGCVLYELLTGAAPFSRPSIMQSCAAVLEDEPAPLREARPEVPEELERAVLRCLQKSPAERFRDIAELASALAPFSRHYAYYAERCNSLLAQSPVRSSPSMRRNELPAPQGASAPSLRTHRTSPPPVPASRLPTGVIAAASRQPVRLATVNPRPMPARLALTCTSRQSETPAPQATHMRSMVPMAPLAVAGAGFSQETTDVGEIPGLRSGRTRMLLFAAAAASIAFVVAYSIT